MIKLSIKFISIGVVVLVCLSLTILGGCNSNMPNDNKEVLDSNSQTEWHKTYPLDSQEVTIWIDNREYEGDEYTIIKITDPEEIASLVNNVKFVEWREVKPEERYDGVCDLYIQFNDQTTIAMYGTGTIAHGYVGRGTPDEQGIIQQTRELSHMPKEFLQTVQQLVEKHIPVE